MLCVCVCARFQSLPKESHMCLIKRIICYVRGTLDLGLWCPRGSHFDLVGYCDADFVGCVTDRKSTLRHVSVARYVACFLVFQETELHSIEYN